MASSESTPTKRATVISRTMLRRLQPNTNETVFRCLSIELSNMIFCMLAHMFVRARVRIEGLLIVVFRS